VTFKYKYINFTFLALSTNKKNFYIELTWLVLLANWHITYQIKVFYEPILLFFCYARHLASRGLRHRLGVAYLLIPPFVYVERLVQTPVTGSTPMRPCPRGLTQAAVMRLATGFASPPSPR